MIITIDGPVASGKSTAARLVAEKLGFYYLNSGFLYRALAYLLIDREGIAVEQFLQVPESTIKKYLDPNRFSYRFNKSASGHVLFDDVDITEHLKSAQIDQAASIIGTNPGVKTALTELQRHIAQGYDLVVDGRDCGSFVFPHADVKFFLTASLETRAQRLLQEYQKRGLATTLQKAIEDVKTRDARDMSRPIAPLVIPEGAISIDSTNLSIDKTVDLLIKKIRQKKEE